MIRTAIFTAAATLGVLVFANAALDQAAPPAPAVTLPCKVVSVTDGDTLVVEVRMRFPVRLLDCWAPESHETERAGEKALGLKSKAALEALAADKDGMLSVPLPASPEQSLASILTFGRVLGRVHVDAGDLSALQVRAGHAFLTKDKLRAHLEASP